MNVVSIAESLLVALSGGRHEIFPCASGLRILLRPGLHSESPRSARRRHRRPRRHPSTHPRPRRHRPTRPGSCPPRSHRRPSGHPRPRHPPLFHALQRHPQARHHSPWRPPRQPPHPRRCRKTLISRHGGDRGAIGALCAHNNFDHRGVMNVLTNLESDDLQSTFRFVMLRSHPVSRTSWAKILLQSRTYILSC